MTATNICYNFVGFRCSPPISGGNHHSNLSADNDMPLFAEIMENVCKTHYL